MYNYKESCYIMFAPYVLITILWVPLTLFVEQYYQDPLVVVTIVDLIATTIVFVQSYRYKNTSVYDPYWQIPPFYVLAHYYVRFQIVNIWIFIVPIIYFLRHNYNYMIFWPGLSYEDFRYPLFKSKFKNETVYWIFSYLGLHVAVTIIMIVGLYPIYTMSSASEYNPIVFYFGVIFSLASIAFETVADLQLLPWRSKKTTEYIDEGLWRYSRHPNYFGECMFWWGLFILALAFQQWYTIIGPITLQSLFLFFSIPAMETHLLKKRPKYVLQQQRVSKFIPWFRKEKI